MKKDILIVIILLLTLSVSCNHNSGKSMKENPKSDWEELLEAQLPLLGHRNWIVVTDMAYPLQSAPGIETIYADEDFDKVLAKVKASIDALPHVFAHVYHDREMNFLTDSIAPGIEKVKENIRRLYGEEAKSMVHEDIITRLDRASKLYKILIVKTPLTIPYTSVFLELDCKYWSAERQQQLDDLMHK